jgi:tetratricopeptide (TPR) repeat protein
VPAGLGAGEIFESPGAETAPSTVGPASASEGLAPVRVAWLRSAESLDERAGRTRRAALERGIWNFDAGASAVLRSDLAGDELDKARAAVRLAPDLPAIRMALARALWLEGGSPISSVRAVGSALLAIPRHFESSLWFSGTALYMLAITLILGGLLTIGIYAVSGFPHAAHDLGDLLSGNMPGYARVALLGSALLAPLALRQGPLGFALGLFTVGMVYGGVRQRWVLSTAAISVVIGAFPVARLSGAALTAYIGDPVVEAAISATDGFATPVDLRRLEASSEDDPLALMALAIDARRGGRLGEADTRYQMLLEIEPTNFAAANNAANVRLDLGHMDLALDNYRRATAIRDSATVLFNRSQAHGQAFQMDDMNEALAAAQQADGVLVGELTQLQGSDPGGFTVDVPLARRTLWNRVLSARSGDGFAMELRSAMAPGLLGRDWRVLSAVIAVPALVSILGLVRLRTSHWCRRCGRTLCPRCDLESGGGEICESCTRLFQQPETTDRALRVARISALRHRELWLGRAVLVSSVLIPGTAGLLAGRHVTSLIGALSGILVVTAVIWRNGVVPDPLIAGAAAPVAFGSVAAVAAGCYAIAVATSLATRKSI